MGKYEAPRKISDKETAIDQAETFPEIDNEEPDTAPAHDDESPDTATEVNDEPIDIGPETDEQNEMDKKRKIILICVCAGVLTLLIGLIIGIIIFAGRDSDDELILDNVYAGGVNLGGMTTEEAKGALHLATDRTYSKKDMVIYLSDDMHFTLSPDDTGAALNVDAVVQAAYDHGRGGSDAEYQQAKKKAATTSYTIPLLPYLTLDLEYIHQTVEEYCTSVYSVLSEPEVTLKGTRPVYDPENPDADVKHQTLRITLGTPDFQPDAEDLYDRILDAYSMNVLELDYDAPEMILPTALDAEALFREYCVAPQDATMDATTYEVQSETYGYGFDTVLLQQQLDNARYGDHVEVTLSFLVPKVLASQLTENMFLDTLGECRATSDIDDDSRNANLKLACDAINNHVLKAGETFSFNTLLGELSERSGYSEALVSEYNGAVMGGGVSQTATALYCSVLLANLDVVERHSHEYAVDFIDFGLDAFVDGKDKDLRFRNNSNAPVRIVAYAENNTVCVELQGINALGYKIELLSTLISKNEPLTIYQDMAADDLSGYRDGDVLQQGVPGYKVAVYMEKRDALSNELLSSLQVSTSEYKKIDQLVVRIVNISTDDPITDPEVTEDTVPDDATQETDTELPLSA